MNNLTLYIKMLENASIQEKEMLKNILDEYRLINARTGDGKITINIQHGKIQIEASSRKQFAVKE